MASSKDRALRDDLLRAIERLAEGCERMASASKVDPLVRDGLIHRFEFCFEPTWKAVQATAAAEGVTVRSPKRALAYALQAGWARDEAVWLRMLEARDLSAHTYDERLAEEVASEIPRFVPGLRGLASALVADS